MSDIDREPLRAHFIEKIGGDASLLPADGESLIDEGILDSFGLAELVAVIEEEYGVKVPDADLDLKNFESIDKIAQFIAGKQ